MKKSINILPFSIFLLLSYIANAQCVPASYFGTAEILKADGSPLGTTPMVGSTNYQIKVNFTNPNPTYSAPLIVISVADGFGNVPYIGAPFEYIPPAVIGKDVPVPGTSVTFNVTTVPESELGTHLYFSVRFQCGSCCPRTDGALKQYFLYANR
ncbi:hypothetical protein [Leadbetterella byssophila]|uniref:Uncharacterized protein n=1 Tax=Leadbetterella byssophila (strain DSM 17132 / JCM 16389 / KACC 11308 / NBRC 106382 / 4M15) TaxID=649349 RepID=E4RSE4_LEAB4|nr:hypothetical protein [Leadbetterella byssophila]ADQ17680.1 hypothetical protein Lbys_1984 [Leadbetterella byssophila DSM 17132]